MNILSFINSLIFSILAATVSVVILFMMFNENMAEYMVLLAVVEAGLLAIVIWCLISIVNYEVKLSENRETAKYAVGSLPGCPDNWTVVRSAAVTDNNGNITSVDIQCSPTVSLDDAQRGKYFKYTFGPSEALANQAFTTIHDKIGTACNVDVCKEYYKTFPGTDESQQIGGIAAWTGLESKCETISY